MFPMKNVSLPLTTKHVSMVSLYWQHSIYHSTVAAKLKNNSTEKYRKFLFPIYFRLTLEDWQISRKVQRKSRKSIQDVTMKILKYLLIVFPFYCTSNGTKLVRNHLAIVRLINYKWRVFAFLQLSLKTLKTKGKICIISQIICNRLFSLLCKVSGVAM
jgi:hypothetical protein